MLENKANSGNKANKRVFKGEGYKIVDDSTNQTKQAKAIRKDFQIVDFCDIDVNEITWNPKRK